MRYSQAEKINIIRLVEESDLPVKQTLAELDVSRSTFYRWYKGIWKRGMKSWLTEKRDHGSSGIVSRMKSVRRS